MSYIDNYEIDFDILLFILSLALFSQWKTCAVTTSESFSSD